MKKSVIAAIVVGILILGTAGVFAWRMLSKPTDTANPDQTDKKRRVEAVNTIELAARPYVSIEPFADGRNLSLTVHSVGKAADSVEYELEYQAGSLLQGAFGQLALESLPVTEKILLGSCSAGGSCTYHEDVKGGSLLLRFEGPERYALKQDWRYFINSQRESEFSSRDAKFQIASPNLSRQSYVVIYNSPGHPAGLSGQAVSEPYSLSTSSKLDGTATVTMRAQEEGPLKIMGWNGSSWQEFETSTDGKTATAQVDLLPLYIVIK